jgi:hypothetical protein
VNRARPRRSPRLGYPASRPVFIRAQAIRRSTQYRRLAALLETPAGVVQFFKFWMRVDREAATAEVFYLFDRLVRRESLTEEQLERARMLMQGLLRG